MKTPTLKGLDTVCARSPHLHLSPEKSGSGDGFGLGKLQWEDKKRRLPFVTKP